MALGASINFDAIREHLNFWGDISFRPAMKVAAEALVAAAQDEITEEGHGEWAPFDPEYLRRRRGGSGGKLLHLSGVMSGVIHAKSGKDFAEARDGKFYGVFHRHGKGSMHRDYFNIRDEAMASIISDIGAWVHGKMSRSRK